MVTKEQIDQYIKDYTEGHPTISDSEYDRLLEEYLKQNGENNRPFLRQAQSSEVNDIVGTLSKVYGVTTSMREGQLIYTDWLRTKGLTSSESKIVIQPKYDGVSIAFDMKQERFFTRGDYDDGESMDVTDVFIDRVDYYKQYDFEACKFEAIMSHEDYESSGLIDKYLRPRDAVQAIISSRNKSLASLITLIPLREYVSGKQIIPDDLEVMSIFADVKDLQTIQKFIDNVLSEQAVVEQYEKHFSIDGVVVSVCHEECVSGEIEITHVYTDPSLEVAIKILNDIQTTKLINIEWQFGNSGRITPVAILEPVMFGRVTVDHVTLSTFDRVINMGLKYNDMVDIVYNIVPYFLVSHHNGDLPIPYPTKCPHCGMNFDLRVLKQIRCTNPNCTGLILGSIIRYAEKMKMFGLAKATITKLYDNGIIETIPDLYRLTPEKLQSMEGFKEKSAKNIIESIKKSSMNVPITRWLGAFPFDNISSKTWEQLYHNKDEYVNDVIRCNETPNPMINDLYYASGIGPAKYSAIVNGLRLYWDMIRDCINYVTFKPTEQCKIYDKKVTLTGIHSLDLIRKLNDKGYDVVSFNKSICALIIPNINYKSSKVTKAKELQIPIYAIDELDEL